MAKNTDDTTFGQNVVEWKLVTPEQLATAVEQRDELAAQGQSAELPEVMVQLGLITPDQAERARNGMSDTMSRPAQQIPGFQMLAKIGSGAMATVFKARQLSLDRIVAVKVLPKRLSENPEFVERFYQEGRAAAKLNHTNIVQAIDVGEAGGYHYFVMEYVEGHTVYDVLSRGKPYDEAEALRIVIQIADALQHAHEKGFIHRDVKPKNIMITTAGVAKLADMGLAREASDVQGAMAEAGRAYGTPYYISPEQIRGAVDVDFRADLYSLGATFYHMVTGRPPFQGENPAAVMHKHLKEPLVPPDHINTQLSAGVGEVIEVMMAKDRRRRYQSAKELLVDLQAVAAGDAPPQARKQIDARVLADLAGGETSAASATGMPAPGASTPTADTQSVLLIVLAAALAASLILNLFLLLR